VINTNPAPNKKYSWQEKIVKWKIQAKESRVLIESIDAKEKTNKKV
jgi:hypothetical protein